MRAGLEAMGAGFADPALGAQQTFRALLGAMAHPGRVFALTPGALAGLQPAQPDLRPPVGAGLAALLLCLVDGQTPVELLGSLRATALAQYLRFHTGAPAHRSEEPVGLAVARAAELVPAWLERLALGSDEAPQDGATLVLEVPALEGGAPVELRGPGIERSQRFEPVVPAALWEWRAGLARALPRGVELVFVHGERLAAVPRSSRLERLREPQA